MSRIRVVAWALCALLAAVPAADAKRKRPRKVEPRYKISINYERQFIEITDCKSTTGDQYRIKETTTTTHKYSESGYFPGNTRRNGYREVKLKTESNDPYVPPDERVLSKTPIEDAFGADQTSWEKKGRYLLFEWETAEGEIVHVPFRAPSVGNSTKKKLEGTHHPERADDERCDNSAEWKVTESVTITRQQ